MVLALIANIALSTIVFVVIVAMIVRAIRTQPARIVGVRAPETAPAVRARQSRGREHRGALTPARPWA